MTRDGRDRRPRLCPARFKNARAFFGSVVVFVVDAATAPRAVVDCVSIAYNREYVATSYSLRSRHQKRFGAEVAASLPNTLDLGASRFLLSLCADRPDFRARGRRSSGEAPE